MTSKEKNLESGAVAAPIPEHEPGVGEIREEIRSEELPDVYKASPYAKELYKALGGDPKALARTSKKVQFWGLDKEDNVFSKVPDQAFTSVVEQIPLEVLRLPESELVKQMDFGGPSRIDRRVKLQFWAEYEAACQEGRLMQLERVVADSGARTWEAYADTLTTNVARLAWFVSPPASYRMQMQDGLQLGLSKLVEIMELPILDAKGKPNVMVASLILQAFKMIDVRLHGMPTSKTVQIHASQKVSEGAQLLQGEELEKKIAELEGQLRGTALEPPKSVAKPREQVIEAEVVDGK